ncbi:hypothetical protein GC089_18105 [Cellulomonas sp. JZ18]|uniref:hypothetical protein n=1 Tax=Cellulomonas sp. JZ18 TaxID=2654191 RepID=UPI0012D4481E|nr:hypothetical protein [Cellulomonas sp. JZ18]QGQ20754.1 hypothetical protein GC089_18105 [Cellulomonas sp. JZ18]
MWEACSPSRDSARSPGRRRPGIDEPTFIRRRNKTDFVWGADAANLQILMLVGQAAFEYAAAKGISALGIKIRDRLGGDQTPISFEDAQFRARQRVALRFDTDGQALELVTSVEREAEYEFEFREPRDADTAYKVVVESFGPNAQRLEIHRRHAA